MFIIRIYNDDGTYFNDTEIYTTQIEAEFWAERQIMGAWEVIQIEM